MSGALLGPRYSETDIAAFIEKHGYIARRLPRSAAPGEVARYLADQKVVGLFQGRMEFGPRALGARSILADPRSPTMQALLNHKIKFRESFRPFAPSVLREHLHDWFAIDADSPYMLMVADVRPAHRLDTSPETGPISLLSRLSQTRSTIPAVTHVDYSARVQTVRSDPADFFHAIIQAFYQRTGCPMVVNTSFNVRDEPIVCTLEDAVRCFMETDIDILVLENFILEKAAQIARSPVGRPALGSSAAGQSAPTGVIESLPAARAAAGQTAAAPCGGTDRRTG
jgi:carbamoyltransferase